MKKNAPILLGVLLACGLAVALSGFQGPTLFQEQEVLTCTDTDGGLNDSVQGKITGTALNNGTFNNTDKCNMQGDALLEFTCDTRNNTVYRQAWLFNCTCGNGTCL